MAIRTGPCHLPSFTSPSATPSTSPSADDHPSSSSSSSPVPGSLLGHLESLIVHDGAGSWPPTPTYVNSWPSAFAPYHTIALAAPERFVDSSELHPTCADDTLRSRIDDNRKWMAKELSDNVDIDAVMRTLPVIVETAPRLGILACLAYLAHLYRWGTLPVVRIAQDEKDMSRMPGEITGPLRYLNDVMGIKTNGGCLYTMTFLNIQPTSGIVYSNMRHLSATYPTTWDAERLNAQVFYDMECLAVPFYRAIASLPYHLDDPAPLLQEAIASMRAAFKLFADMIKEGKVKKDVWMSHAQGFHGWGVDGFDGVSGEQSIFIRTLDAFLGIPTRTRVELVEPTWFGGRIWRWWWKGGAEDDFAELPYSNDYVPAHQVAWIAAVRRENLRGKLGERPEVLDMVRQLRLWRLGHTRKAVYYEDLELPERKPMTASGGVGGGVAEDGEGGVGEMIRRLEMRLRARVEATK